jgi:hypothetical protein
MISDPYEVIQLFPSLVPEQVRQPQASQLLEKDLENGILALISYLTEVNHPILFSSPPFTWI